MAFLTPRSEGRNASGSPRARVEHDPTSCKGPRQSAQGFTTPLGNAETLEHRPGYCVRPGEEMRGFVAYGGERLGERFSAAGDEPAGEGAGAGHGDLLAEHRTEGKLVAVRAPWYAPARRTANERATTPAPCGRRSVRR